MHAYTHKHARTHTDTHTYTPVWWTWTGRAPRPGCTRVVETPGVPPGCTRGAAACPGGGTSVVAVGGGADPRGAPSPWFGAGRGHTSPWRPRGGGAGIAAEAGGPGIPRPTPVSRPGGTAENTHQIHIYS
jgi:hypothetical protein